MSAIKGPAIFLAQFLRDEPPYNDLNSIGKWVAGLGYRGIQIPPVPQLLDLDKAASSRDYCDQ
ncbi:sugar phosphate isomerase/epimerase, partial [Candidatus Bathyarchaeota archaeon]|nr:sugar phosphate isomerase/epimerase [Candidatus Bathyarchaeota archaeon]